MSTFQAQPQQGQNQVQPVVVYPNPLTKQPGSEKSHHHSNGSFGTVFIVLAVIVVISAIACFLGRLCNRRVLNKAQKPSKHSHNNHNHNNINNNNNNINNGNNSISSSCPKDQSRVHEFVRAKGNEGDIEFGAVSHQQSNNIVNNINTRPKKEGDIEFGFDTRLSSAPSNGKPNNAIHGNSTSNNNSMRSGSRGHVAFEKSGDHSKHQGGVGGKYYDYHGGPRASE